MAEFIIGSPLRKLAREHEPLRQFLWRLDYGLLWLLEKLLTALPVDLASRLGARIGGFVGPLLKRKTAIFRSNFATAFPDLNDHAIDRLVRDAWARAGRILAEYPHLAELMEGERRVQIEMRARIPTYDDPSRPCVVVTAHQSNWEVVGAAMAKLGIPNASLYSPPTNPLLDRLLLESRKALNCQLLPRDNSARLLLRALKEGRTAAMVMDRRVDEGKPVQFFGHDKLSTVMPAKLALKFDCPLVPAQVVRLQDAHFRVIFHAPITPSCPDADENAQAMDMIQQVHHEFEQWIRDKPEDWFCSKRLWPKKGKIRAGKSGSSANSDSHKS
ncbi:MAG: lauroyl acyltransferase [Halioglobus sp.]|nr:lauroyl acyltransferase [Halioglobus sp.]